MRRLGLVALVALAFPGVAFAHATLEQTTPSVGQRLASSPREVTLRFDQSVRALSNAIQVYDAKGRLVSGVPHMLAGNSRVVVVPVRALPRGGYTVRWAAISNDSHVGRGVFTFGVRVKAPEIAEAYGASVKAPRPAFNWRTDQISYFQIADSAYEINIKSGFSLNIAIRKLQLIP